MYFRTVRCCLPADIEVVSYADIIIASFFYFLKRIDQSLFDRAVAHDPVLKTHYDASIKWFERDDH